MSTYRDTFKPVNVAKNRLDTKLEERMDSLTESIGGASPVRQQPTPQPAEQPVQQEPEPVEVESDEEFMRRIQTESYSLSEPDGGVAESDEDFMDRILSESYSLDEDGGIVAPVPVEETPDYLGLDSLLQDYEQGSLTKEAALSDNRIVEEMRRGLEFRFGDRSILGKTMGTLSTGLRLTVTDDMSDEEVYEMWQNWQRSFHGGQTVTLTAETAFIAGLSDEEKAYLGAQYTMFDKSPNIFSSEVGWGEMFDGTFDYVRAALYDPTTVVSLGVGRALTMGGTKASGLALRESMKKALHRQIANGLRGVAAKEAVRKEFRNTIVKETTSNVLKYSAVDFVANVGGDALLQRNLMATGAQEEYSALQTGVAALATIAIPAVMATSAGFKAVGRSEKAPDFMRTAVDISDFKELPPEEITRLLRERIDYNVVTTQFSESIQNIADNPNLYKEWSRVEMDERSALNGVDLSNLEKAFFRSIMFGASDGSQNGFAQTMQQAGLFWVPRSEQDTITTFVGDVLTWVPDELIADYVSAFAKNVGDFDVKVLKGLNIESLSDIKTGKELAALWQARQSEVGSRLWDSSELKRMLGRTVDEAAETSDDSLSKQTLTIDLLDNLLAQAKETPKERTNRIGYVGSLFKSTLTATPATTGVNLKGFAAISAMNTMSDVIAGALNLGVGGTRKLFGGGPEANLLIQQGMGSITGAARRGVNFLGAGDTMNSARAFLELNPEAAAALSRDLGGDSGASAGEATIKTFGLNPESRLNRSLEGTRDFIQTVSGVKLQDELTKQLAFMSHLDQYTREFYGVSYNRFMEDEKLGFIEMMSPRYQETVVANALDRTLRETGNKSFLRKQQVGTNVPLEVAKAVERFSAGGLGGAGSFILPFGKWFNTSTAILGDYAGVNLARYTAKRMAGGPGAVISSERLSTLTAKAAVGWGGVMYLSTLKEENVRKGLPASVHRRSDGSLVDLSREYPDYLYNLFGQAFAHKRLDGEVPEGLRKEISTQLVGNTLRSGDEFFTFLNEVVEGEVGLGDGLDAMLDATASIAAGFSRPLDPINSALKVVRNDFEEPDRNTSGDTWTDWERVKKATRYVDQFFEFVGAGPSESPKSQTGFTTTPASPVIPSLTLGVREGADVSLGSRVINSIGKREWTTFRWGGDSELRNYMNSLVAPLFDAYAEQMLVDHPDFFEYSLSRRERLITGKGGLVSQVRKSVYSTLDSYGTSEMKMRQRLERADKDELRRSMTELGFEGDDVSELLKTEEGIHQLKIIMSVHDARMSIND